MDFVSQEHEVPCDGPKDSNAGGWTWEILDRNETRWRKPRVVERTTHCLERDTELYPGGPHGEVKALLPAFLYYDAIPREEYKALITEL
jgi:hypothetical protein